MENLNPVEYGKLLAKVEGLEAKVNSMDADKIGRASCRERV